MYVRNEVKMIYLVSSNKARAPISDNRDKDGNLIISPSFRFMWMAMLYAIFWQSDRETAYILPGRDGEYFAYKE